MKRYLIASATVFEIRPLLERLGMQSQFEAVSGACFRQGPKSVDVLVFGVGQMQAAYHLGKTLSEQRYSAVLNFGIAGSFNDAFPKCALVQIVQEQLADLGAEDGTRMLDLFEMKLLDPQSAPFRDGALVPASLELACLRDLPKVKSITVNRVLGTETSVAAAEAKYHPDVVNMEGAAVFYACASLDIPCVAVRAISDKVGPRDKSQWDIPGAIRILCTRANQILDELLK